MQVKGTAVRSIPEYIQKHFPAKYEAWLEALPEESRTIYNGFIQSAAWYPLRAGIHTPTEILGKVMFEGDLRKAAWECGRYTAATTLTGIYKFFVMAAPPSLVVKRAGRIMSTFYQPSEIIVANEGDKWALLHITRFDEITEVVENRIGGWIEKALEIQKIHQAKVTIEQSMSRGDSVTAILIKWA